MRATSRYLTALARDDRGVAGVVLAGLGLVLVGMVGLAVDIGNWYATARRTQSAADAAAVAAAFEVYNKTGDNAIKAAALREAQKNGFSGAACALYTDKGGATHTDACQVYNPPRTDSGKSGESNAVQVVLKEKADTFFASAFTSDPTVSGNSVMQVNTTSTTTTTGAGTGYCMLALDKTATDAMRVTNNGGVNCGIASWSTQNSSGQNAQQGAVGLRMDNNATVNGNAYSFGGIAVENNATLNGNSYAKTAQSTYVSNNSKITGTRSAISATSSDPKDTIPDPYANWDPPESIYSQSCADSAGAVTAGNKASLNLNPGHYCNGWDFSNNVTVNLSAGVYVINSKFTFGNNATLNATGGVTIVFDMMHGQSPYQVSIGNNTKFKITAPTSGTYSGIALYSYRNNPSTITKNNQTSDIQIRFNNNSAIQIQGAIYAPSQMIHFDNNSGVTATDCTQFVGRKILVDNNGAVLFGACNTTTTGTTSITVSGSTHQVKTLQ
jgi:Flp pilus assembly protein TadG